MAALLAERNFHFVLQEYNGGHNYTAWRRDLIDGLVYLFPPL
jgi:enterochelin esterase-like enzyme